MNGHSGLNPTIWHTWLTTAWVGAGGVLADAAMDPNLLGHLGLTAGAGLLGTFVGGAVMPADKEEHRRLVFESGMFGTVTGLAAGAWAWCADAAGLFADLWQPGMWGGLALGGVAWGAVYTGLRVRLRRARDPKSETAAKLRKVELGGDYEQIFHDAGFGLVEVLEVTAGFGGASERVLVELDLERNDTAQTVINAKVKLMGIAARVMRERRGIRIPGDAVTITEVQGDAKRVFFDVTLRDVLTEKFDPSDGEDITVPVLDPEHPLMLGFYQHGAPIEQPEAGPHGVAVGSSGSGKSTYFRAQIVQHLRRPHVVLGIAGMSKLSAFLRPFMQPVVDGRSTRSPFAIIGGGDNGTSDEVDSAVQVLMAAYTLYRHRMANPRIPRDDGGNVIPTPKHPRFIAYLDEVDALVKAKKDGTQHIPVKLPNGEKVTIPHMLTTLGSKGRSEGVELEIGTQRTTDSHMGFSGNDLFVNTNRRAIFRTQSNHDARAVGGERLDPTRIPEHTFVLALGPKAEQIPAKVFYYSADHIALAMQAAAVNGTFGDLSGDEAAALGELWSGRWSAARFGHVAEYFGLPLPDGGAYATSDDGSQAQQSGPTRRTGGVDRVGARSTRLQEAIERARREAAGQQAEIDDSTVNEVIAGMEAMLASSSPTGLPRDAAPADVLSKALEVIGDRVGAEPAEILGALGWVSAETSQADYNRAAEDLRDTLRAATGNPKLTTKPKRIVSGESPKRVFVRDELEGKGQA
ncbi:hypothetical protein [Saccharopolyspora shandongensis]|uniref:hypothetical protein n=1 Tax=Saccharopolyspora shandongensis TaxID=418495 RepID=UPI0033D90445